MSPTVIFIAGVVVTMFVASGVGLVGFGYAIDERARRRVEMSPEPSPADLPGN